MAKTSLILLLSMAPLLPLSAKDAVKASVTPLGTPTPIVTDNGNPYASGTYAVGTIQLLYTVNAFQFTAGNFATFRLDLLNLYYAKGQSPTYPVGLTLSQTGSANLTLSPAPDNFSVTNVGWTGSSIVTISIPNSVATDPALNSDGTDLVGNLQLMTVPQGSQLDTVTTVQIKIKLVHPTDCLRVFDFITDQPFSHLVESTEVNVNTKGKVTSTNPYGQLSDDILVVNRCGTPRSFDLKVNLDPSFETSPQGNPGNAVFTYLTTGFVDPTAFNIAAFGTGTPRGEGLCLTNVSVPAGDTFLTTVHMGINNGMSASLLPGDGMFDFTAELRQAGSGCLGALESATPNPVTAGMSFTTR